MWCLAFDHMCVTILDSFYLSHHEIYATACTCIFCTHDLKNISLTEFFVDVFVHLGVTK